MPDYNNGKIYAIRSHQTDEVYIGSTTQKLSQRLGKHRSYYNSYKRGKGNYISSIEIIQYPDHYIELIKLFPCNLKCELLAEEGRTIRETNCVNKEIAGRTRKQYRIDNKELINLNNKNYREKNKDKIKEWREKNKEKLKERAKEYYRNNKDKFYERNNEITKTKNLLAVLKNKGNKNEKSD